jgi:flap endonuclease-1
MKNKRLGIDASILIYRSELAIKGSGFEMRNKKGDITSHLYVIFFKTIQFLKNNIIPIYVFDGYYHELKHKTMSERKIKAEKLKKELEQNKKLSKEEILKKEIQSFLITDKMLNDLYDLLDYMGIPYIIAEYEADSLLAFMNMNGYIDGVISEDTDICIFGATDLYKNVFPNMNNKKKLIEHIQYENILEELDWTRNQFVMLAILLGSDYSPHVKGIGIVSATELVETETNVKHLVEKITRSKKLRSDIIDAYKFMMTDGLEQSEDIIQKLNNLKLGPVDKNSIYDFLVKTNQLNEKRVIKGINDIKNAIKNIKKL